LQTQQKNKFIIYLLNNYPFTDTHFQFAYWFLSFILLLNLGLELKYQTDFKEKDLVITYKISLGLFGNVNLRSQDLYL